LSNTALNIEPSPTFANIAKVKALKERGVEVYTFLAGEPDFRTTDRICEAAIEAMKSGQTGYTVATGIAELKEAIQQKFEKDQGVHYGIDQIVVSCGAKHSLYLSFISLLDRGDEVIVPAPYWVTYPEQIRLAGGVPIYVNCKPENGFILQPEDLEAAITRRTRAVVINSPNNPTGVVYTREQLQAIMDVAMKYKLALICDDIYEKLIFGDVKFTSMIELNESAKEHCIVINGVSKSYAMTGWRIGYLAAPKDFVKIVGCMQGQMTSNPNSIAQWAALEAISGNQSGVEHRRQVFQDRRDLMVELINATHGMSCHTPHGAFYAFADVRELLGKSYNGFVIKSDKELADYLLDEAHVAVLPGTYFGARGFVRFSYATSKDVIHKGMELAAEAVKKLR